MSPVELFNPDENFWEVLPQYRVAEPFKSLYKKDKSRGKKDSSLMMWFVVLCYDRGSKYFKLTPDGEDGKHYVIGGDYCGNVNYYEDNKDVLDSCISMYIKMNYSAMERHLKTWEDLLDKRTAFLQSQDYNLETFEDLDKMAVGTEKVYKTIKNVLDDLNKEDSSGSIEGGGHESLND
jgi:hypothetical protein